ncbi:division/outer membrane stress-associated lipid-binding lipoprotein [Motilimonas eburnea]|uniref:division/outer membrane stress-associated lipid-binding lipoprotein n=1 Tax=Motilimonas eburnea TaxID=1737488 RepID=UPI001E2BDF48|nr:division/outer membrane stress-associated lipid-binding lipoprotein [Motilimonas eburnea]MCE2572081.1 divisome-associated lipoprotein YraP [Motilimonas eburnea]
MKTLLIISFAASLTLMQGCAGVIVAGAAGTASVAGDSRSLSVQMSDQNIESKAYGAIKEELTLYQASRISVIANNGNVLLIGQTPTSANKSQVEKMVKNIDGVRRVFNEIRLKKPISLSKQSSDSWITTKVKSLLLDTPEIASLRIKVVTEDTEVFLIGLVTEKESDKAVDVARHVKGVTQVIKVFEYIPE